MENRLRRVPLTCIELTPLQVEWAAYTCRQRRGVGAVAVFSQGGWEPKRKWPSTQYASLGPLSKLRQRACVLGRSP